MLAPETIAVMETAHQALDQAVPPEERLTIAGRGRKQTLTLRLLRDRKPQLVIAKTVDKAGNAVRFDELTEFPNNRFRPHHSAEAAKWTTVKGLYAAARMRVKNAAGFNAEWSNAVQTAGNRRKAARQARRFAAERTEEILGPAQAKQAAARLTEFIGPELWSMSKKIWGDGTTLGHLNFLAAAGTGNVRSALSQSPQLVRLALRNAHDGQAGPIRPEDILEKGRRYLREIMGEGANPQETEEEWIKALERIDPEALQKPGVAREYLPELVRATMEAGRKLPRFVVRELYEKRPDWNPFVKKENEQEKTMRRRVAAAAARCLDADPGMRKELEKSLSLYPSRIKTALEAADKEPDLLLKELAGEERKEAEKGKPGKARPGRPQYSVKKPDADRTSEALAWLERTSLIRATRDSAALTAGPEGPALYEIRREADGTLVQESRETASPLMDSQGRFQWKNSRPMPHFNAPAIALAVELHPEIVIGSGAPEAVAAVCEAAGILKEAGIYGRLARRASREMAGAASRLCRPEAAERAVRIAGRAASPQPWIDIEQHNAALTAGAALEDLSETNPGAAAYLLGCHPEKIQGLRHPGQLVTIAKKHLPRRNPERIWKRIAGAEPEAIDILAQENPERKPRYGLQAHLLVPAAAEAANMAGTGRLNRDQARMLRQTVGSRQQPRNQGYDVFLSLCMKEPLKALETPAEAILQAEDYCRNAAPTARTLGGLLKASRRWHLGISHRRIEDLVRNRRKLVWESVIGEQQVRKNITAVPLNGTMELAEESRRMGHCVYTYDIKCHQGDTRIFHLSTGATCELRLEEGRWSAGETKREKNMAPTEKDKEAARRLAEMTEYCDFAEQETIEGGGRPDLLVKLPEGRYIPVDAKASTTAFMEAGGAETGAEADAAIEKHAKAMKSHVDELARRRYGQGQDGFLDFVVMFVPGDQFLTAALRGNSELLEYAMSRRVAIATPASLISMLWAVANGWQQSRMAQNAKEIAKAGEELHKRMNAFMGHYQKVGQDLEKAVKGYNTSINAYDRNVHTQGAKFGELLGKAGEIPGDGLKQIEQTPRLSQKAPLQALPAPEDGA